METVIVFFLCTVIACTAILISAYILTKYILLPYKHKATTVPPEQLFVFLKLVIENEIDMFDRETFGNKNTGISNSDYENYYTTLCTSILDGFSEEFIYKMSFYLSEEHLAEVVSTTVHDYLVSKIQ